MRKKGGYAMVLVLCIMALFTALCFALLLSTSLVLSAAKTQRDAQQCRLLAASLSSELEKELTSPDYSFDNAAQEQQAKQDSLWFYVKEQISGGHWPAADENAQPADKGIRRFRFTEQPKLLGADGSAEVVLYRMADNGTEPDGTVLTVEVTCRFAGQSCCVRSTYGLAITEKYYVNEATTQPPYECWQWSLSGRE